MVDVTDLVMTKHFINEKQKEIDRLAEEIYELKEKLERKCTHPTTTTTRDYHPGGYDYVSEVVITTKCSICEKTIKSYSDPNHRGMHA
ncbi:MAG TPA: hypothetical protein V6C58_05480 [Allocoleopsis sp.]